MRCIFYGVLTFFLLLSFEAKAEKILLPPHAQPPECREIYEETEIPKTMDNLLAPMHFLCYQKEGLHVLHRVLPYGEEIDEPSGLLLTCIGENPEVVLFSCFYSTTYEDL